MDLNTSSEEYVPKIMAEEEDLNSSDDSALLSRIEERNRSCPICQHVYTSNTDFLTHSASHYTSTMMSGKSDSVSVSPTFYASSVASRPMSSSSSSTASSSLPNSPNSIEAQSVFDYPSSSSRPSTSLAPQPHHRPPPPSYYSSAAVASNWAAQSQATANFWSAAASANFQTPGPPTPFYGTAGGYQSGYEIAYPSPTTPADYTSYYHNYYQTTSTCVRCKTVYYNYQQHLCPIKALSSSTKCKRLNCNCPSLSHKRKTSSSQGGAKKRKAVEKENIDPETMAKYKAMEWEQRMGYWCSKCQIRFPSSDALVEHMAKKDVHKNKV